MSGITGKSGKYDHYKIRGTKKGPLSPEIKKKISVNRKGKGVGNKNSLGKNTGPRPKGITGGEKNGMWKGGVSSSYYKLKQKEIKAGRKKPEQCEICHSNIKIDFDHHHECNKFRGWICRRCNLVLGMVKDNASLLNKLSKYVSAHECNQEDIETN